MRLESEGVNFKRNKAKKKKIQIAISKKFMIPNEDRKWVAEAAFILKFIGRSLILILFITQLLSISRNCVLFEDGFIFDGSLNSMVT